MPAPIACSCLPAGQADPATLPSVASGPAVVRTSSALGSGSAQTAYASAVQSSVSPPSPDQDWTTTRVRSADGCTTVRATSRPGSTAARPPKPTSVLPAGHVASAVRSGESYESDCAGST